MWDIPHFKAIKELLHSSHFWQILSHPVIVTVIFFLHLFCYQLGISPNKESPNDEILSQPKTHDQPLVLCNVICSWEFKFNYIFQDITFRRNEHDANPRSFENIGSIELHHPMIR
jgi:hypothetical protein